MNTPRQLDSLYSKKEAHNKEIWKQIKYQELLLDRELTELIFGTSQDKKEAHNKEIWKQIKYHERLLDGYLILGTSQDKLDTCLTIRGLRNQLWK